MKNRRVIEKIKKIIFVMTILLIIVSISFGITYSNFIYKSDNHKAVEMYVTKLDYDIFLNDLNTNKVTIAPGNSILNVKILSKNDIETYFKLLYFNDENIDIYYINNHSIGRILSNDEVSFKLLVSNSSSDDITLVFDVSGGYINNDLDDVIIQDEYNEISRSIDVGDYILYYPYGQYNVTGYTLQNIYSGVNNDENIYLKSSKYRILNINEDGTIDIISDEAINTIVSLNGSLGFNNGEILLDDICNKLYGKSEYAIKARNLNINDIIYTLNGLQELKTNNYSLNDIYYPINDNDLTLNTSNKGNINIEEYFYDLDVSKDNFINPLYYDLFINEKNNWISSNYIKRYNDTMFYGIYSIKDNHIELNNLYDSLNNSKEFGYNIRPIITLSSNINLSFNDLTWNIN